MFTDYENKGLSGLANLGNTCYMNSCIHVLSHCYELDILLKDIDIKNRLNNKIDSILLLEWKKLRELIWSKNCTIAPYGFLKAVQKVSELKENTLFNKLDQNDLEEFLIFLIDSFHNSLKKTVNINILGIVVNDKDKLAKICYKMIKDNYSKDYSEILNIFNGISVTQIKNMDNELLSCVPEMFSVLNLPIVNKNNVTIFDCLDMYCNNELLEGENAWYNEKTNEKESVNKSIIFWSLPEILIIDFKRYTYDEKKITTYIDTPIDNIDLSKYVYSYDKENKYQLFAICNHIGNIYGGHYYAYIKNANNKWYEFNDTSVKEISENNIVTRNGYCFFYRKIK